MVISGKWCCLLVVFAQALLKNLRIIILAHRLPSCFRIVSAFDDTPDERFLVNNKFDHDINRRTFACKHLFNSVSLRQSAWIAV